MGNRIREARERRGITISEFALAAGISIAMAERLDDPNYTFEINMKGREEFKKALKGLMTPEIPMNCLLASYDRDISRRVWRYINALQLTPANAKALAKLQAETDTPVQELTEMLIRYALEHIEIKDEDRQTERREKGADRPAENRFAQRLRMLRKGTGITIQQLGDAIGFAKSTVTMWEVGKKDPNIQTLIALAQYFNCTLDYLIGLSDE